MGNPITPPQYGDDCLACYASGTTPKNILVLISGVTPCPLLNPPAPLGGAFVLTQSTACKWLHIAPNTTVGLEKNSAGANTLCSQINSGIWVFGNTTLAPCAGSGGNQNVCMPLFVEAENGHYFADDAPWPATPIKLTDTYGLIPSEDTMTDPYIIQDEPPTTMVYTFANRKYSTKLRVLFDYTI